MTKKLISLITAIGILYVYLQSQLQSGDALFLVTSDNIAINLSLLGLASATVYISFSDKFKSWKAYVASGVTALACGIVGLGGFAYVGMANNFATAIKPLDYIILMLLSALFGIFTLSYRHPARSFELSSLQRFSIESLSQSLASSVPKPTAPARHARNASAA